eukprot:5299935-Pyramimonas_sp.AAC.1
MEATAFLSLLQGMATPHANPADGELDQTDAPSEGPPERTAADAATRQESEQAGPSGEAAADEASRTAELIMQHLQQQESEGEASNVTAFMSLLESVAGSPAEEREAEAAPAVDDGPLSRRVVVEEGCPAPTCSFCGEQLEEVHDTDEWIYKNSIRVNSEVRPVRTVARSPPTHAYAYRNSRGFVRPTRRPHAIHTPSTPIAQTCLRLAGRFRQRGAFCTVSRARSVVILTSPCRR